MVLALGWTFLVVIIGSFLRLATRYRTVKKRPFDWRQEFLVEAANLVVIHPLFRWVWMLIGTYGVTYFTLVFYVPQLASFFLLWILVLWWWLTACFLVWIEPHKTMLFVNWHAMFMTLTFMMMVFTAFVFWQGPYSRFQSFFPITSLIQASLQLLIILNPTLKDWFRLENVSSNEKPLYQRPQWFVLAYSEWLSLFNGFVWIILLQLEWLIG